MPSAAALRKTAPRLVVLDSSSSTMRRRAARCDLIHGRQRSARQGRQNPAVDVEAGDGVQHGVIRDEVDPGQVVQIAGARFGAQQRPHLVPGGQGPAHDLLALGDEQAVLGLDLATQGDVGERAIVGRGADRLPT